MQAIKEFLKKYLIPESLLKILRPFYHGALAMSAAIYYGRPAGKMAVIGITGTAGKSTTVQMLERVLNESGRKCGFITTIGFSDGEVEQINKHGLSMPGGWLLQKQLKQMVLKGCRYAIVECTSEGLAQNRHLGIGFIAAVFTNLSAAHLDAHGGFENYRAAKGKLFKSLAISHKSKDSKTIVANLDDENAEYFLNFKAGKKIGVSLEGKNSSVCGKVYRAKKDQGGFELEGVNFEVKLAGEFNAYNALLAAAAAGNFGVTLESSAKAIAGFDKIRGRMEAVGNNKGISIFVDYGCEPASMEAALKAAKALPYKKLIHVFGSTGGHRDVEKRFEFGKISARYADIIIITNDDVYDSSPEKIADDILDGLKQATSHKLPATSYDIILDRRQAIHHALEVAQAGDLVLITGKGSEQFLVLPGNKRIDWDEVSVVKDELAKM